MSAAWDAMIAAELEQGAPITAVPGIAPSLPTPPHVASSQAGLASIRGGLRAGDARHPARKR